MKKQTVVIVEDDVESAELVALYLHAANFDTKLFDDSVGVVEWVQENEPALLLLDIELPTLSGLDLCRQIRGFSDVSIIMITAKVEEVDRLIGLEIGADDYVCKPYSLKELILRVKANLRRVTQNSLPSDGLHISSENLLITYKTKQIELTAIEFSLFHLLYANRIYSRAQIMELVYQDYRVVNDRTVDSHIRNLRRKFK